MSTSLVRFLATMAKRFYSETKSVSRSGLSQPETFEERREARGKMRVSKGKGKKKKERKKTFLPTIDGPFFWIAFLGSPYSLFPFLFFSAHSNQAKMETLARLTGFGEEMKEGRKRRKKREKALNNSRRRDDSLAKEL